MTPINVACYLLFPGAYVPLTMDGNIMVDGVLISCYPSVHHALAHIVMAPMRWFPMIMEWMYGNDDGVSAYALINEGFTKWFMPSGEQHK